jgi:hypothetical protein
VTLASCPAVYLWYTLRDCGGIGAGGARAERGVMIQTVRGKYHQGKIDLHEPLDLEDGTEVAVTVAPSTPAPVEGDTLAATARSWAGNVPDDFEEQVYADRRRITTRPAPRW